MKPIIVPKNIEKYFPQEGRLFPRGNVALKKKDVEEFLTYPVILKILGFFSSASRAP